MSFSHYKKLASLEISGYIWINDEEKMKKDE